MSVPDNDPLDGEVESFGEAMAIVCHPAFRLGFLDAQQGRPIDHFSILDRIYRETPQGALERLGWAETDWLVTDRVIAAAVAECRYEEGRLLHLEAGARCKAWGHPDYPPRAVMDYLIERFAPRRPVPSPEELAARKAEWQRRSAEAEAERLREAAERARQGVFAL